jgi:cyclopropane fatty-acyl-phospholipid synthase-like methyltransferase
VTQDEIIEMAREAGFEDFNRWCEHYPQETQRWCQRMEAFAKLVAAKEREACAKVCESYLSDSPYSWGGTTMAAAIRARGQA